MISFDSSNLESAYLLVNRLNKSDAPSRDIQSENIAFQDGFNIVANFWRSRTIVIGGTLDATSSAHLATLIDTLKQNLSGVGKNLDLDFGNGTRRYLATLSKLSMPEEFYNITNITYTAEFLCQPFGYDTSNQNVIVSGITTSPYNGSLSAIGTYKPTPVITITMSAASGVTGGISFANTTTGDVITIPGAIASTDVIVIDTDTQKVTKNGVQVDFNGPIPNFAVGINAFTVTMGGTSRTYNLAISYIPRYL